MVARLLRVAATISGDRFVVANSPENFAFLKTPVFRDAVESVGPLAGIYTALEFAKHAKCLVLACDLPFVSMTLLEFLATHAGNEEMFAPRTENGVEPLCAIYAKSAQKKIQQAIETHDLKAQNLARRLRSRIVEINEIQGVAAESVLANMNTPEDFVRAKAILKGESV